MRHKSMMNDYKICSGIMCFLVFILSFPFFIQFLNEYQLYDNYIETKCNITTAIYPHSLSDFTNSTIWKSCDCGKYCESLYPCLTLYSDKSYHIIKKDFEKKDSDCTFVENECKNGEDPNYLEKELNKTITNALYYLDNEVDCFIDDTDPYNNLIFLELNQNIDMLIFSGIFLGLSLCILIIICMAVLLQHENEKISKKSVSPI